MLDLTLRSALSIYTGLCRNGTTLNILLSSSENSKDYRMSQKEPDCRHKSLVGAAIGGSNDWINLILHVLPRGP